MNTSRTLAATLTLAAVLATQAQAGPTITIDGFGASIVQFETPPVFDFTSHTVDSHDGVTTTWDVDHAANGRLRGRIVDSTGGAVTLTTVISGLIRGNDGTTTIRQKLRGSGDLGNKDSIRSIGLVRGTFSGWGADATLTATTKMRTCTRLFDPVRKVHRTLCNDGSFQKQYDYANAGDWLLRVALNHNGSTLFGAGSMFTGTSRDADVSVAGTYLPGGRSVLKLGPKDARGQGKVSLSVTLVAAEDGSLQITQVHELRGMLLGQRFNEVVP